MKSTYHLIAYILLVGFMLQSCNDNLAVPTELLAMEEEWLSISTDQVDYEPLEDKQVLDTSKELILLEMAPSFQEITQDNLGDFDSVPRDILKVIFSYAGSKEMSQVRQLNKAFYKLTTGYNEPGVVGVEHKSQGSIHIGGSAISRGILNFKVVKRITPKTMPSFVWYYLVGEVKNIFQSFWPYLRGTKVHTVYLGYSQIGNVDAVELIKHLKGTQVHTLDLKSNEIGSVGAIELAKHLLGTSIQTLDLSNNKIEAEVQQTLREQYPYIEWKF